MAKSVAKRVKKPATRIDPEASKLLTVRLSGAEHQRLKDLAKGTTVTALVKQWIASGVTGDVWQRLREANPPPADSKPETGPVVGTSPLEAAVTASGNIVNISEPIIRDWNRRPVTAAPKPSQRKK